MTEDLEQLKKDLEDIDLPHDLDSYNKIKCDLLNGKRIYWYYRDDKKYCDEIGEDPRMMNYWSGIIVIAPDREHPNMNAEIEIEDCIIVMDWHPCEKCYPETAWLALKKLLDDEDLVEIYA